MQIGNANQSFHLTYCTNIHAGNGWDEVFQNIKQYTVPLKAKLSPNKTFGVGLRLSNLEAKELLAENNLKQFKQFLYENGLYVFTLNGFVYGLFHKAKIKEEVFAPDWQDNKRVGYTISLIKVLAEILPKDVEGSISTAPLSYKDFVDRKDSTMWEKITSNLVKIVKTLVSIKKTQGKFIHLDFEPEPNGLIETTDEVIVFYNNWLLKQGIEMLSKSLKISSHEAFAHIINHLRICYDTCHMAVQHDDIAETLKQFQKVGIKIGKIQVSSALKIPFQQDVSWRQQTKNALLPFAKSPYLHQVVQKNNDGSLDLYKDLPDALEKIDYNQIKEWTIHFHVPIFQEQLEHFYSTYQETKHVLEVFKQQPFSPHIELETYTWDILPEKYKTSLLESIEREYRCVLEQFR